MLRNVISIKKRQGDTLSVQEINNVGLDAYKHINNLRPDDIGVITTQQFEHALYLKGIPNYCGHMTSDAETYTMNMTDYQYGLIDSAISKMLRDIDAILEEI